MSTYQRKCEAFKLTEEEAYELFDAGFTEAYLLANPSIDFHDPKIESIDPKEHRIPDVLHWYGFYSRLPSSIVKEFLFTILNKGCGLIDTKHAIQWRKGQDWDRLVAWGKYWFPQITEEETVQLIELFWKEYERLGYQK